MGMRILTIQKRAREVGRIRLGEQRVSGKSGKSYPARLETFRFTSTDAETIRHVAGIYGGEPAEWDGGWQVVSGTSAISIAVPGGIDPVSQSYEMWSAGGCQRRCDGITEHLSEAPCMCPQDPEERESLAKNGRACKPTLRVSLLLPDIPVVGVWRLETHGFYANTEIPPLVEMLQAVPGHVRGVLRLEPREVKRGGETRKFTVPVLDVHVSMDALIDGRATERPALPKPTRPELPAGPDPRPLPDRHEPAAPSGQDAVDALFREYGEDQVVDVLRRLCPDGPAAVTGDVYRQAVAELRVDILDGAA